MPKIIINEKEIDFDASPFGNLKKLYEGLLKDFAPQRSVVATIKLNGESLNEGEFQKKEGLPVSEIESFELIILTLQEIALNNIINAMEYLAKLIPSVQHASGLFRTKSPEEANQYFLKCVEGLTWFQEMVDNINNRLKKEFERLDLGSKSTEELQKQLLSLANEIADSQSKRDWVMLADLLEYELVPYLEEWESILPLFVKAAQKKSNKL